MRATGSSSRPFLIRGLIMAVALIWAWGPDSKAQNDWQFPDPYFGILEVEKSRPPVLDRRPRPEIGSTPRVAAPRARFLRPRKRHGTPVAGR